MNGSPAKMGTISGTAGHSSALKMKAESALKQMELSKEETKGAYGKGKGADVTVNATGSEMTTKSGQKVKLDSKKKTHKKILDSRWKKGDKASGGTLNELVSARKGHKKGSAEYAAIQNKINKSLGSKKVHKATTVTPTTKVKSTKTEKTIASGEIKKEKIATKAAKKTSEVTENVTKKTSKISKKDAKKKFGKGSKEFLEAKKANLEAKESDRQGSKGGRKQGLFRKLSSKINARKQKKNQEKLDAKNETPAKKALVGNQKNLPEHLKAKIDAAPGKMYGKSMAKKYDK